MDAVRNEKQVLVQRLNTYKERGVELSRMVMEKVKNNNVDKTQATNKQESEMGNMLHSICHAQDTADM